LVGVNTRALHSLHGSRLTNNKCIWINAAPQISAKITSSMIPLFSALIKQRQGRGKGTREPSINLKTAVAGLKMAHLPKIALAFEHLHHFDRP
jgi:hypothetical protein